MASKRGHCSNVTDVCCEAPANGPAVRVETCTQCGEDVCTRCSRLIYMMRVCHNCEVERAADAQRKARRLTRTERHQLAADAGVDTWEDYRGER